MPGMPKSPQQVVDMPEGDLIHTTHCQVVDKGAHYGNNLKDPKESQSHRPHVQQS